MDLIHIVIVVEDSFYNKSKVVCVKFISELIALNFIVFKVWT